MKVIPSAFATYCDTVLGPLLTYLSRAQILFKDHRVAVMHGGDLIEAKRVKTRAMAERRMLSEYRQQAGCLQYSSAANFNEYFNIAAGSEVEGRLVNCDNVFEKGEYPEHEHHRTLTIVGHTPQTLGIPTIQEHRKENPISDEYKMEYYVQMDTQNMNRRDCSSCIAFNNNGEFVLHFSLPVPDKQSFSKLDLRTGYLNKCTFLACSSHDFSKRNDGYRFAGHCIEGAAKGHVLLVACWIDKGGPFDDSLNLYKLEYAPLPAIEDFKNKMQYAMWGDVEGNKAFLNGCQQHLVSLKKYFSQFPPKIICSGDVVGPSSLGNEDVDIDEAYCVQWANTTDIKLIGNRDFNKTRLLLEYPFYQIYLENKSVVTSDVLPMSTYPLNEDDEWLHGKKENIPDNAITKIWHTDMSRTFNVLI